MKKLRYAFFFALLLAALCVTVYARGAKVNAVQTRIYFVDTEMLRLLPVKVSIPDAKPEHMARRVCDEIIDGRDDNPKIRRIIPKVKRGLRVKVRDGCAYVDISREVMENMPEGRDIELLAVYQIVNSLTELDGIVTVRFTIEGEVSRDFMGYIDMRETFVPDYFI